MKKIINGKYWSSYVQWRNLLLLTTNSVDKIVALKYYWTIIRLGDGGSYFRKQVWQVNTKDSPTKQVRQDAILGGLSIGQFWRVIDTFIVACAHVHH